MNNASILRLDIRGVANFSLLLNDIFFDYFSTDMPFINLNL